MASVGRGSPRGMRLFQASTESPDLTDMMKTIEGTSTDRIRDILEFVRKDVLYYLKSYTDVSRPPRYQRKFILDENQRRVKLSSADKTGWRPAHPGGWADVTDDLRKKYYTTVEWVDGGWRLTVGNSSEHAAYVEAMDGLFVVHGVMEPGGPVAKSIKKAIAVLGLKGWKVTGAGYVMAEGAGIEGGLNIGPRSGSVPDPSEP